jgi:hypothetical protein
VAPWAGLAEHGLARLTTLLQTNENPVWPGVPAMDLAFTMLSRSVRNPESVTIESGLRLFTNQLLLALLHLLEEQRIDMDEKLRSSRRAVQMFLAELERHLDHS